MEQDIRKELETILREDNTLDLFTQMLSTKSQYMSIMEEFVSKNIREQGENSKNLIVAAMLNYRKWGMIDPEASYLS